MKPLEEYKQPHKDPFLEALNDRVELPKSYTQICCPKCNAELTSDEMNIQEKIGKCGSCHVVFPFSNQLKELTTGQEVIKEKITRPAGVEMFSHGNEMEISIQQPSVWLEWIMFGIYGVLYLVGFILSIKNETIWPFITLFILPTVIFYIYYLRRKESHRLFITVNKDYLSILNRPKKLMKDLEYACTNIKQIYAHHRKDHGDWQVRMIMDEGEGEKHVVLAKMKSASMAKFIEQEIEAHLSIKDAEVKNVS